MRTPQQQKREDRKRTKRIAEANRWWRVPGIPTPHPGAEVAKALKHMMNQLAKLGGTPNTLIVVGNGTGSRFLDALENEVKRP